VRESTGTSTGMCTRICNIISCLYIWSTVRYEFSTNTATKDTGKGGERMVKVIIVMEMQLMKVEILAFYILSEELNHLNNVEDLG
jgi:hypothetical protein